MQENQTESRRPGSDLFRAKSVEQIASPEQMHDYMKVTSPRLWMLLGVILALLVGFVVYASTAQMETTIPIRLEVYWNVGIGYGTLPAGQADNVQLHMPVRMGSRTGTVTGTYRNSVLQLILSYDGDVQLPDGSWELRFEDESDPEKAEPDWGYVTVMNGVVTASDGEAARAAFRTQRRVSIGEARVLATVTGTQVIDRSNVIVEFEPQEGLESGIWDAEIVTETTTPLSFLFN